MKVEMTRRGVQEAMDLAYEVGRLKNEAAQQKALQKAYERGFRDGFAAQQQNRFRRSRRGHCV